MATCGGSPVTTQAFLFDLDYRVYQDPADLLLHLDEVGIRVAETEA
jgi:hypothetical protein